MLSSVIGVAGILKEEKFFGKGNESELESYVDDSLKPEEFEYLEVEEVTSLRKRSSLR